MPPLRRSVEQGLWVRVQAYHEGHTPALTELGLLVDRQIVTTCLEILEIAKPG